MASIALLRIAFVVLSLLLAFMHVEGAIPEQMSQTYWFQLENSAGGCLKHETGDATPSGDTTCGTTTNYQWLLNDIDGDFFQLMNVNTGQCLELLTFYNGAPNPSSTPMAACVNGRDEQYFEAVASTSDSYLLDVRAGSSMCFFNNQGANRMGGTSCEPFFSDQRWTPIDLISPVISCPAAAAVVVGDDSSSSATGTATCTDERDTNPDITEGDTIIGTSCVDEIERTWTCTDHSGNTASCIQQITFIDNTAPIITCPANQVYESPDPSSTDPSVTGLPTCTDDADPSPVASESDTVTPGSCPPEFTIDRVWQCTDCSGNVSPTCSQSIIVDDTTPPDLVGCPGWSTVSSDFDVPAAPNVTCIDASGQPTTISFEEVFTHCFRMIRTWTCDTCGGSTFCTQVVTIDCTEDPTTEPTKDPTSDPTKDPTTLAPTNSPHDSDSDSDSSDYIDSTYFSSAESADSREFTFFSARFRDTDDNDKYNDGTSAISIVKVDAKTNWHLMAMCAVFVFVNGIMCFWQTYNVKTHHVTNNH